MTYNLNLIPGKVPVAVHVKQYDTAPREVTFNLCYGDAVYTIPSSVTITVSGTKPDGNGFAYNVTEFSGSTVTVPMEEQMTVLAGEIPCQLTIAQTSGVIGTATFTLCVEPAALSSDTPVSDTELAAFQQMLTQTQQEAAGVAGATAQIATNTSNIATNTAAISSLNSNLSKNVADGIIDGSGNFTATFIVSSSKNRVPVLIGGNNTNSQFLRLYQIDLANLTSSLTEQTRFADCVSYSGNTITVLANADGGNTSRLRIRVSQTAGYSHVFICPMVICTLV